MIKLCIIIIFSLLLEAQEIIKIDHATFQKMGRILIVNAKITQLSNQQLNIVSRIGGHLEAYEVSPGERLTKGTPVARLRSLALAKMTANYLALKKEQTTAKTQLKSVASLYQEGLVSQSKLNAEKIALSKIEAHIQTLAEQLRSLGIDPHTLKKPIDTLVVRAHASGRVEALLVKLHTNLSPSTPIVSLTTEHDYYAIAYLDPIEAYSLHKPIKATLTLPSGELSARFVRLAPRVDTHTQRAKALFHIEGNDRPLLLDLYTQMRISLPPYHKAVTVRSSALTMFQGEWVVFTPTKESFHKGKGELPPYRPLVVSPGARFGDRIAIKGLKPNTPYVSDGVYFIKSMLLKSQIGEDAD